MDQETRAFLEGLTEAMARLEGKLTDTQHEMQQGFASVAARFDQIDQRFAEVDHRFGGIVARLDKMDARFDQVNTRFDDLERIAAKSFRRVEERLSRLEDALHIERLALVE
ncbi:MAG: hypothetical protein AAGN64_00760 [Bacteroidota bacterium]